MEIKWPPQRNTLLCAVSCVRACETNTQKYILFKSTKVQYFFSLSQLVKPCHQILFHRILNTRVSVIINLLSFFVYATCSWTRAQAGAMSGPWLCPGAETRSAHIAVAHPAQAPVWSEAGAVLSIPGPRGPLPDIDKDDKLLPPPQALRQQHSVHIFVSDNILNILVWFFWGTQLWYPLFVFLSPHFCLKQSFEYSRKTGIVCYINCLGTQRLWVPLSNFNIWAQSQHSAWSRSRHPLSKKSEFPSNLI